jgi:hypothetical protein
VLLGVCVFYYSTNSTILNFKNMPTGYTAGILDGKITTFPQFAKLCMRAFGAAIHLRDESLDAEYEPRVPSDYHSKAIEKANQLIIDAQKMSDKEIVDVKKEQLENSKKYHLKAIEKAKKSTIEMNKILADVRKWQPPTPEHTGIKDFMIDQIEKTIDFDCKTDYHDRGLIEIETELLTLNATEIRKQMIEQAKKDLDYHNAENLKEIQRCEQSNKWVSDLMMSLPA